MQRFVVEPNQFPREQRYIEHNLDFTRRAFGLDRIERVALPYRSTPAFAEGELLDRLAGVPLWDPRPLLTTYRQQQGLFRYYTFNSVHHDRYPTAGGAEPLAISVRELETNELEEAAQTWQNLHLNYVSGQGAVVTPVSRMEPDGTTPYYVWDLDPPKLSADAPEGLALERPEVYFGERTREYIIVDAAAEPHGIALNSIARKLLFAWAFQSKNILLADAPSEATEIVFRRRVPERVQAVAPFLRISPDRSAYPVISEGRIVWVVDAFTTSSSFPLAPLVGFDSTGNRLGAVIADPEHVRIRGPGRGIGHGVEVHVEQQRRPAAAGEQRHRAGAVVGDGHVEVRQLITDVVEDAAGIDRPRRIAGVERHEGREMPEDRLDHVASRESRLRPLRWMPGRGITAC